MLLGSAAPLAAPPEIEEDYLLGRRLAGTPGWVSHEGATARSAERVVVSYTARPISAEQMSELAGRAARAAALSHPLVASVRGARHLASGHASLVEEELEGDTLAEELARSGRPLRDRLAVLAVITDVLVVAHDAGLQGTALSPSAIVLSRRRSGVLVPRVRAVALVARPGLDDEGKTELHAARGRAGDVAAVGRVVAAVLAGPTRRAEADDRVAQCVAILRGLVDVSCAAEPEVRPSMRSVHLELVALHAWLVGDDARPLLPSTRERALPDLDPGGIPRPARDPAA